MMWVIYVSDHDSCLLLICRLRDNFTAIQHINLPGQTAAEVDAQVNLETKTVRELANLDMFDNRVINLPY